MVPTTTTHNPPSELARAVLSVISQYLGIEASKLYENYYSNKSSAEILSSASELFEEVMGPQKAQQTIKTIKARYVVN